MEVRQAQAADWEALRQLRLRALADAPDAFASTLEVEMAFPDEVGRQGRGRKASSRTKAGRLPDSEPGGWQRRDVAVMHAGQRQQRLPSLAVDPRRVRIFRVEQETVSAPGQPRWRPAGPIARRHGNPVLDHRAPRSRTQRLARATTGPLS